MMEQRYRRQPTSESRARHAREEAHVDQRLLDALRAAGWTQADVNRRDAVSAYLLDHGLEVRRIR
jgi:hypothetical protein